MPADATCGACLLELNEDGGCDEQESSVASRRSDRLRLRSKYVAALEGCMHLFHVRCIQVWSEVENSCPQCRSRFRRFGEFSVITGELRKACEVMQRDQMESSEEEITCDRCGGAGDAEFLLLCDGRSGRCPGACHTYCDGLGYRIPRGRWLCLSCRSLRTPRPKSKAMATNGGRSKGKGRGRGRVANEEIPETLENSNVARVTVGEENSKESLQPQGSQEDIEGPKMPQEFTKDFHKVKLEHGAASSAASSSACSQASYLVSSPPTKDEEHGFKVKHEEGIPHPDDPEPLEEKEKMLEKLKKEADEKKISSAIFTGLCQGTTSIDLEDEEETTPSPAPRRRYQLLSLPKDLEDCAEQLRRFASAYFLCERSMPLASRTADRLWKLSQIGPCPKLLASDENEQMSCRQLLNIARDSFELFWQKPVDPGDDDPCGLRCLRRRTASLLCVRYKGSRGRRGRIRPSDIVRCELQCRRRLLELLDTCSAGVIRLAPVELPEEANSKALDQEKGVARATAALSHMPSQPGPSGPLNGMDLVEALKAEPWYVGQAVHVNQTGARTAHFAEPKAALHPLLKEVLGSALRHQTASGDVIKLYSHQAEAIDAILMKGQDVIVSTSTGSGKSLIYLIAIFEALLKEDNATAILIFPTKALANDQLRTLKDLAQALIQRGVPQETLTMACLDGDTPVVERAKIRKEMRVILTNPDMLHSHVLPQHIEYSRLLHNARYLVLDEAHVYRGAFGAHVCSVMRRLRRLVESDGSDAEGLEGPTKSLQFVACSATVANPGEHFERLLGRQPLVVSKDGSPSGGHIYVLWNPASLGEAEGSDAHPAKRLKMEDLPKDPPVDSEGFGAEELLKQSSRASPIVEVTRLLAWLVSRDVSVLAFCKWRTLVELVLQDVRDALLASDVPDLSRRVVSYRGGYPPNLRRQLEHDIFHRKVLGVACTNALELGVDIGKLDCTISLGFPGSVASLRQQFGRAGRAGRLGLSFYVAFDDPTDQHFMRRPRELLARRPESVAVAPCNPAVLQAQLPCAAAERPLEAADSKYWEPLDRISPDSDPWETAVQNCLSNGTLERMGAQLVPARSWVVRGGPHRSVSIRAVENHFEVLEEVESVGEDGGFLVQHKGTAFRKLDEIDVSKAKITCSYRL